MKLINLLGMTDNNCLVDGCKMKIERNSGQHTYKDDSINK